MIHQRSPRRVSGATLEELVNEAKTCLNSGVYFEALDLLEQCVSNFPAASTQILSFCYDIYKRLPQDRYHLYQARHFNFPIEPGARVLDIGSGNIPFPSATELAELTVENNQYGRAGAAFKPLGDKKVTVCNIEETPFQDNEFDFVYCSHVLEHVHNPEQACKELMRVAKRGYIETPNSAKDLFMNSGLASNHLWKVSEMSGKLDFEEYTPEELEGLQCNIIMSMHCTPETDREKALSALIYLKSSQLNTMFMWEGSFAIRVQRNGRMLS